MKYKFNFLYIIFFSLYFNLVAMERSEVKLTAHDSTELQDSDNKQLKNGDMLEYFSKIENCDSAAAHFSKAENCADEFTRAGALHVLGYAYYKKEKFDKAQYCWEKALECSKRPIGINSNLAILHYKFHKDLEKAEKYFEDAIKEGDLAAESNLLVVREKKKAVQPKKDAVNNAEQSVVKSSSNAESNLVAEHGKKEEIERQNDVANNTEQSDVESPSKSIEKKKKIKKKLVKNKNLEFDELSNITIPKVKPKKAIVLNWTLKHRINHKVLLDNEDKNNMLYVFVNDTGSHVIGMTRDFIYAWDTKKGHCIAMKEIENNMSANLQDTKPVIGWNAKEESIYLVTLDCVLKINVFDDSPFHLQLSRAGKIWPTDQILSVFNFDCSYLASVINIQNSCHIALWDLKSGSMKSIKNANGLTNLFFIGDGKKLCGIDKKKFLRIWDCDKGELILVGNLNGTFDEKLKIVKTLMPLGNIVDYANNQLFEALQKNLQSGPFWLNNCLLSPDGRLMLAIENNNIKIYDTDNGNLISSVGSDLPFTQAKLSDNAKVLTALDKQGRVSIWSTDTVNYLNIATEHELLTTGFDRLQMPKDIKYDNLPYAHYEGFAAFATNYESVLKLQKFVTATLCDQEKNLAYYEAIGTNIELDNQKLLQTKHSGFIWAMCRLKDINCIATGSDDNTIMIWDVNLKICKYVLTGHSGPIWALAYDEETSILYSGSSDRNIIMWNMKTGKEIHRLKGHLKKINQLKMFKIQKEDKTATALISCSDDNNCCLWDVKSGKCIKILAGHTKPVRHIAWTPKSDNIVTCSEDGTLKIWDIETGSSLQTMNLEDTYVKILCINATKNEIDIVYEGFNITHIPIVINNRKISIVTEANPTNNG